MMFKKTHGGRLALMALALPIICYVPKAEWQAGCDPSPALTPDQAAAAYGRMPRHFEPNQGQFDARARFVLRRPGSTLFLTDDAAVLLLTRSESAAAMRIEFAGANEAPRI